LICVSLLLQRQQRQLHPQLPSRQLAAKQRAAAAHQRQQNSWACLQHCWLHYSRSLQPQTARAETVSLLQHKLPWKHMMLAHGHQAAALYMAQEQQQQQQQGQQPEL
jgi:hypothetical protein